MKIFKRIALIVFIFFVLTVVGVWIAVKTFNVNKYVPQITASVSQTLGRSLEIGVADVDISFRKGAFLRIEHVSLSDDPSFSTEPFFVVNEVFLGVDLMALVTQRQLLVSSVEIMGPRFNVIRNKEGEFNFTSLLNQMPQDKSETKQQFGMDQLWPIFHIQQFDIISGAVTVNDEYHSDPAINTVNQINISVLDFSALEPFTFTLDASLWSDLQNISLDGTARMDLKSLQVRFDDIQITSDLSKIRTSAMAKGLPFVKPLGLTDNLKGQMDMLVSQLILGQEGLLVMTAEGEFSGGYVAMAALPTPLSDIQLNFEVTDDRVNIKKYFIRFGEGEFSGHTIIKDYLTDQRFQLDLGMKDIAVSDVLKSAQPSVDVDLVGKVNGHFSVSGQQFDADTLLSTLKGTGEVYLNNGVLKGVNVLEVILRRILSSFPIPVPLEMVETSLPAEWVEKLQTEDTRLDKLAFKADVRAGKLFIENAVIEAEGYGFQGQGTMDLHYDLEMESTFFIEPSLSASIVKEIKEFAGLLAEDKRIKVPVKITGTVPQLSFTPDRGYLQERLVASVTRQQLDKVIEKNPEVKTILNTIFKPQDAQGGKETPENVAPSGPSNADKKPAQNPEEQLLDNVFDAIFTP